MKRKDYVIFETTVSYPDNIPYWPLWKEINSWITDNPGVKKEIAKRDDKLLYVNFLFPTTDDELAFKMKFGLWQR